MREPRAARFEAAATRERFPELTRLRGASAKDQDTAMTAQNLKHATFVFERTCAAPVERVFAAFANPVERAN
jgi:hypothetical protein